MSKHTPGPWKPALTFVENEPDRFRVFSRPSNPRRFNGDCIAVACGDNGEANARLIAAAPELLEACKAAVDCLGDQIGTCVSEGCNDEKPCSYCVEAQRAVNALESAIAKAEDRL